MPTLVEPGTPAVSIILPLDGSPEQALRCFEGLASLEEAPAHEVIVVDDASIGLDDLLASLDGDVAIVRTERRLGFAGALACGLREARGETVVLLRRAAAPSAGWLAPLVSAVAQPDVGAAVSVTDGVSGASAVAAWALAARRDDAAEVDLAGLPEELCLGALALALTEGGRTVATVRESVLTAPGPRSGGARRAPGEAPELTVVIPTLDAASERVRACIAAVQRTTDCAHEIVIVDNGSPPQGFSAPVNAGLRAARTPYLVVMNDDVEPLPGWWAPLRSALDSGAPVVFPLTVDGAMRYDFAAWCFAMSATTVSEHAHGPGEFFDPSLVVWFQDTDLLLRLRAAGTPPRCVEASRIRHGLSQTVASEDPDLARWVREQVARDEQSFLRKHPSARPAPAEIAA